nr:unnamed protein product [Callosobruchus analis]
MKPYPGTHNKGSKERHFNYRLSRARRVVENVFGIMSFIFRVLHNFLRKSRTSSSRYTPPGTFNSDNDGRIIPGTWRQDIDKVSSLLPLRNIPRKSELKQNKSEKHMPNILRQLVNYRGRTHMLNYCTYCLKYKINKDF